jgi:predicted nucleotidyltransferase component of viral defense system
MIHIDEIRKFYPDKLHPFSSFLLREYLQFKILEIIYQSPYANQLIFMGGTAIRIVHQNQRFSEDLDFDNLNISENEFLDLSGYIKSHLEQQGYQVEINEVIKGAFHCYIRFPKLLFEAGLSGYAEQKILIQIDTEPQHFNYTPQKYILNKFDVFNGIAVTPVDILLSQKFYALINRKRKKGRDIFDILYLMSFTKPNYDYLQLKIQVSNPIELREKIIETMQNIDLNAMKKDVSPFVFNQNDLQKFDLFLDYIQQVYK